jgi:hypothetical protein
VAGWDKSEFTERMLLSPDAMEIWVPDLISNYDKQITCFSFAIGFADNDCVETIFPANNPVDGLKEIYCTNPMSPNNLDSFWSVYLKKEVLNNDNQLINDLVDSVNNLYAAWKNEFNLNPDIKVTYLCSYFIENGVLTPNAGIKQIKDYVRENPNALLNELIDKLNQSVKQTKKEFYTYLLSKDLINYFGGSESKADTNKPNSDRQEKRLALASTIVNKLFGSKSFGRTKFAKVFYIADMICKQELDTSYYREAAGPIDYKFLYDPEKNIELIGANRDYFYTDSSKNRTKYHPGGKTLEVNKNFDLFFSEQTNELENLFNLFYNLTTEQAEIIATLYACWNDLIIMRQEISDQRIITEVKKHWHINKLRFSDDRLQIALNWMKENKLLPKGNKSVTKTKKKNTSHLR